MGDIRGGITDVNKLFLRKGGDTETSTSYPKERKLGLDIATTRGPLCQFQQPQGSPTVIILHLPPHLDLTLKVEGDTEEWREVRKRRNPTYPTPPSG